MATARALNPRHLKAFVAVARTGSVARSAQDIHRVRSVIARSVKELEEALGAQLFERRPHGMLLTEAGKVLLARAESALREMSAAKLAFGDSFQGGRCNPNAPIFTLSMSRQRLSVFVELMKIRHMEVVAEAFRISQPAVSQVLREVEQSVGASLVSREPTGLVPNALGLELAVHVSRALGEIVKAEEEIASLTRGIAGHVVVGSLSLGRNRLLPNAIIALTRTHPLITVSTIEGSLDHLATLLRSAEIDFVLGGLRPSQHLSELTSRPVARSRIALIGRHGHPYSERPANDWTTLEQARWVLPPPDTWTRSSLEAAFARKGLGAPHVVVETADLTITRGLLLGSDLLTAASPSLFLHEIETQELAVLPFALPAQPRDIGIIQRENGTPTAAARLLMQAVVDSHLL